MTPLPTAGLPSMRLPLFSAVGAVLEFEEDITPEDVDLALTLPGGGCWNVGEARGCSAGLTMTDKLPPRFPPPSLLPDPPTRTHKSAAASQAQASSQMTPSWRSA